MNKSEQMQVIKARKFASMGELALAANTLAILDRAANTRSRREIREVLSAEGLAKFLVETNGCLVLRAVVGA